MSELDSVDRFAEIKGVIDRKYALKEIYRETYAKYSDCLDRCPSEGKTIELGSGGGFVKDFLPKIVTTDVLPYPDLDLVVDATHMPFPDKSLNGIVMLNVFHHIPDVEAFFKEADRCLLPGGRIFISDQNKGWISGPILKYAHHEPFLPQASEWKFESTGPLSDANGALAWIVFKRDIEIFKKKFPSLKMTLYKTHTPLRYWLSGGLKSWNLLPKWAFGIATLMDRFLARIFPQLGSFVDIELVKKTNE